MMRIPTFLFSAFAVLLLTQSATAIPGPSPIPVQVIKSSAPSKQIRILNEKKPGGEVDVQSSLVSGRTNVVVFFADW